MYGKFLKRLKMYKHLLRKIYFVPIWSLEAISSSYAGGGLTSIYKAYEVRNIVSTM